MAHTHQTVELIDPHTLLVDSNIRQSASPDKDFVASIRDLGVLQPIIAVRTPDGDVRVRYGHRRTLAAVEAEAATVPVIIAADEGTDDEANIERLVGQYAENEHRTGLTNTEKVGVMEQLAAFGISPAQIAKRTKTKRRDVDSALSVARSDLARSASERYDFLTLDQAAAVAEFEDDDETVKALVVAASEGRFEHVLQRARDQRAETEARRTFVAALEASGLRVIDRPPYGSPVVGLHRLIDAEGDYVDSEVHRDCPGHVVWPQQSYVEVDAHGREVDDQIELTEDQEDQLRSELRWVAVEGCDDPVAHGHRDAYNATPGNGDTSRAAMSEQEREQARAERRRVIENNKAWASAETVRREWLAKFVTRKSAPKQADLFIATAVALDAETATSIGGNHLAATWLGCEESTYGRSTALADTIAEANGARAKMLTLAIVLAGYEDRIDRNAWRSPTPEHRRYLRFIADCGYNLAEVEELVIT